MKKVRLGIIGCSGYAWQLIKRIGTLPRHARLVAAMSPDPLSNEARWCESLGVRVFDSVEDLLDFGQGRLDAILNPTPIHLHKPLTLQCLEAGFPVWLEKPPVATVDDLDELAAASAKKRCRVDVCFNSLYAFQIQRLKAELVAGNFGQIHRIRSIGSYARTDAYFARSKWAGRLQVDGLSVYDGTINNPLAHVLCNNLFFAAREHHALAEAESVEAELWHGHAIESEDTSSLRIRTREGVEVLSHLTLCPEEEISPLTVIDADRATIRIIDFQTVEICWADGGTEIRDSYKENRMEMLEELSYQTAYGGDPLCSLSMTRPFTSVVNAAFEQVLAKEGCIPGVMPSLIDRFPSGGSIGTRIKGINVLMMQAHESGKLLGECSAQLEQTRLPVERPPHQPFSRMAG